ncbi:unnamed protein product, partial [Darwinula stevensoni]
MRGTKAIILQAGNGTWKLGVKVFRDLLSGASFKLLVLEVPSDKTQPKTQCLLEDTLTSTHYKAYKTIVPLNASPPFSTK